MLLSLPSPYLHQLRIWHSQQASHIGKLMEELVRQLPKAHTLGPFQDKPQGGPDSYTFGPVEAAQRGAYRERKHQ